MAQSKELGAGAWSYFGDPRAISHDGHTFTGWISTVGHVWVARLTKGGTLTKHLLFRGLGRDDHNNPSLVFLPDGRLAVVLLAALRPLPAAGGDPEHHALPDLRAPVLDRRLGTRAHRADNVAGRARLHVSEPDAAARQAVALLARRRLVPDVLLHREQDRLGAARASSSPPPTGQRPYASTSATARRTSTGSSPTATPMTSRTASTTSATRATTSSTPSGGRIASLASVPVPIKELDHVYNYTDERRPRLAARHRADVRRAGRGSSTRGGLGGPSGDDTFYYAYHNGEKWVSRKIVEAGKGRQSFTSGGAIARPRGSALRLPLAHDRAVEPGRAVVHARRGPDVDDEAAHGLPEPLRDPAGDAARPARREPRPVLARRRDDEGLHELPHARPGARLLRACDLRQALTGNSAALRRRRFGVACARCSPVCSIGLAAAPAPAPRRRDGGHARRDAALRPGGRAGASPGPIGWPGSRGATTPCSTSGSSEPGARPAPRAALLGRRRRAPARAAAVGVAGGVGLALRVTDRRGATLRDAALRAAPFGAPLRRPGARGSPGARAPWPGTPSP